MTRTEQREGGAIEMRYLDARGARVTVELRRNGRGTVAARFFLASGEAPIIDAPSREAALQLVQCAIDALAGTRSGSRG